jgi:transcriptional regulator with XRE-family HTH domain
MCCAAAMARGRPQPRTQLESDIFAAVERIYAIAHREGMTIEKLAHAARGNFRSFNNWRHGHHVPTLPKLLPFAEAVNAQLRLFIQPNGELVKVPGMTIEGAEVAEYLNAIDDPKLRGEVRDACARLIPVMVAARGPRQSE